MSEKIEELEARLNFLEESLFNIPERDAELTVAAIPSGITIGMPFITPLSFYAILTYKKFMALEDKVKKAITILLKRVGAAEAIRLLKEALQLMKDASALYEKNDYKEALVKLKEAKAKLRDTNVRKDEKLQADKDARKLLTNSIAGVSDMISTLDEMLK